MRAVSRTPVAPDREKRVVTLPQAFEAHACATPAAAAVLAGDREVSYGEMNGMANRLAHRLAEVGVGPEQFVAVCARRSVDTLVAILAVLKAGGAFVPVDPADPQERLAAVIQDARPRAVLAGPQDQARFGGTETLWLDSAVGADESGLRSRAGPDHAACVYYTSGSTAEAKGVVLEHRAVLNQLSWVDRTLLGERSLALPLINRLPFAASLKQLFVPWLRGEAVRLVDDAIVGDPATLLRALSEQPLVALNCVPHLWHAMLQAAHAGLAPMPETLAAIWFAGESPTQSLLDRSFAALPDLEVWNVYAATETGISLAARIGAGERLRLGKPIDGVEAHVLDGELRPVEAGELGELHIGGAGLARGYLRRPALTGERFIADPFADRPGARLFKTGDLVRRRADDGLEFVRRLGRVLKVRGFRIEPAEVEEAIDRHPAVARCAVTAASDGRGGERLVACVVPAADAAPTLGDLRSFLASRLPSHMLPSSLAVLDALPTTSSGKLDRRALEAAALRHPRPGRPLPARNPLERRLLKLWRKVLGLDRVGVTDDFFELGGDSLCALRVVAEIERKTGVRLPASILLEASTPERMAKLIARSRPGQPPSELVKIRSGDGLAPFFCVAPTHATVLPLRRLAAHLDGRRAVYALQSYGLEDDGGAPVETIAARYLAAITEVQPRGPYLLGGHCFGALVALEAAQQLRAAGEAVGLVAVFDGQPPLVRAPAPDLGGRERARSAGGIARYRRRLRRRIAWVRWRLRRPRHRLAFLWRALRAWREAPSRDLPTLVALYRQRSTPLRRFYAAEPYPGNVCSFVSGQYAHGRGGYEAGWRTVVTGGLEWVTVPGAHRDLLSEPAVVAVAAHLNRRLEELEAAGRERVDAGR